MSKRYIIFKSLGSPIRGDQCTTAWPSTISCTIPLSGELGEYYYNIMVMNGPNNDIESWLNENVGKVTEVTKEEADELGQQIVPPGTERVISEPHVLGKESQEPKTYIAAKFDVDHPENLWVLQE